MIVAWIASLCLASPALPARPLPSLLTLATAQTAAKKVEISVDVKEGDVISGERKFVVTVLANSPVNQVEFIVNGNIQDSDTSTPYEFKLDTMTMNDGPVKLAFAAYTNEGDSSKKEINVKVDNGMDKGPEFHVNRAKDLLAVSKWDDAIQAGRVALKIKKDFNPARLIMARAYFGKGVLDTAQKFAEDALAAEPNNSEAKDLLSGINLNRAFNTFSRSKDDKKATLAAIRSALRDAVLRRMSVLESQIDAMGEVTDANRLKFADLCFRANRYGTAISALASAYRKDTRNIAIGNRLAYAQIRAARWDDAAATLGEIKRANALDAVGYSLLSIVEGFRSNDQAAEDAIKEALISDPGENFVKMTQCAQALRRGKQDVLTKILADMAKSPSLSPEVTYYLSIQATFATDYDRANKMFERTVLAEPALYDMYIQRGNEALAIVAAGLLQQDQIEYQFQVAKAFYETALDARRDSPEALTALSLAMVLTKQYNDSIKYARAATGAGPGYAPAQYTLSMIASIQQAICTQRIEAIRRAARSGVLDAAQQKEINDLSKLQGDFGVEATTALQKAGRLDSANLEGRGIPKTLDAYRYFSRLGRLPLLTAPKTE